MVPPGIKTARAKAGGSEMGERIDLANEWL
jgi:hypothetical protein